MKICLVIQIVQLGQYVTTSANADFFSRIVADFDSVNIGVADSL